MNTFISSSHRKLERIFSRLENQSKRLVIPIAFFSIVSIAACDYIIGRELDITYAYIFPVALVSWFVNQNTGILVACLCAIIGFISARLEGVRYSSDVITLGNILLRGGLLIAVAFSVARVRSKLDGLSDAANTDFLTGLPNGRAFYEVAAREIQKAFGLEPVALAYIDIDGFKWINYRFGYATGDQMLCSIAQTIREGVTRKDLVGRIGGTAFAVLLPKTTPDGANFILEKIHGALKSERRRYAQPVNFFISAIACKKAPRSVAELMHQAEISMTRMKGNNRDALEVLSLDSVPPLS